MKYKPYTKVLNIKDFYGSCAIYEPHPFRKSVIKEAVEQAGRIMEENTWVADNEWCWVYYDWCGNPVGLSENMPDGEIVDKFTAENIGSQDLADYFNEEPANATT